MSRSFLANVVRAVDASSYRSSCVNAYSPSSTLHKVTILPLNFIVLYCTLCFRSVAVQLP